MKAGVCLICIFSCLSCHEGPSAPDIGYPPPQPKGINGPAQPK